jgi:hypothetical protein
MGCTALEMRRTANRIGGWRFFQMPASKAGKSAATVGQGVQKNAQAPDSAPEYPCTPTEARFTFVKGLTPARRCCWIAALAHGSTDCVSTIQLRSAALMAELSLCFSVRLLARCCVVIEVSGKAVAAVCIAKLRAALSAV